MMTQNEKAYIQEIVKGLMRFDDQMREMMLGYGQCINDSKQKEPAYFKGYAMAVQDVVKGA